MLLSVPERILLLNMLPPAEGDFLFLRSIRNFRESLGFSEVEASTLGVVRTPQGAVAWTKDEPKEIEIGPSVAAFISRSILAAPRIKEEYFDFLARFVKE